MIFKQLILDIRKLNNRKLYTTVVDFFLKNLTI